MFPIPNIIAILDSIRVNNHSLTLELEFIVISVRENLSVN